MRVSSLWNNKIIDRESPNLFVVLFAGNTPSTLTRARPHDAPHPALPAIPWSSKRKVGRTKGTLPEALDKSHKNTCTASVDTQRFYRRILSTKLDKKQHPRANGPSEIGHSQTACSKIALGHSDSRRPKPSDTGTPAKSHRNPRAHPTIMPAGPTRPTKPARP